MAITFELGDPERPRGHALVFFRDARDAGSVAASYVVALPLEVDIARYVPPFLAGQLEGLSTSDMSSFTFPPAPERVDGGLEWVLKVARARDDDVLDGGVANLDDATSIMTSLAQVAGQYLQLCREAHPEPSLSEPSLETAEDGAGVDQFVYELMSEPELLRELTALVGRLRFAVEGGDRDAREDAITRIHALGRSMPGNRQIDVLCDAAAGGGTKAAKVAQLYLDRAYALHSEDYLKVREIETQISTLAGDSAG